MNRMSYGLVLCPQPFIELRIPFCDPAAGRPHILFASSVDGKPVNLFKASSKAVDLVVEDHLDIGSNKSATDPGLAKIIIHLQSDYRTHTLI